MANIDTDIVRYIHVFPCCYENHSLSGRRRTTAKSSDENHRREQMTIDWIHLIILWNWRKLSIIQLSYLANSSSQKKKTSILLN